MRLLRRSAPRNDRPGHELVMTNVGLRASPRWEVLWMNQTTRVILALAAAALAAVWIFPSWIYVSADPHFGFKGTIGSYPIFDPPMWYGAGLDWVKQLAFSALVVIGASGLLFWSR